MALFSIQNLTKTFGSLTATNHIDLQIEEEGLLSIIGPNGAGKTTFFNLLTGLLQPDEGKIFYKGKDITNLGPSQIIRLGISRSFQIASLFPEMTVLDNVRVGIQNRLGFGWKFFSSFLGNREVEEESMQILERAHLTNIKDNLVSGISHGDRKILDLAMALTHHPEVLLLDEPMSGLAKGERTQIVKLITEDFKRQMKIVIVEHDMDVVFALSDDILVLHQGSVLAVGKPEEISANHEVQRAYLGGERAVA